MTPRSIPSLTFAGTQVPAIGLGTWHLGDDADARAEEIRALRAGLDAGLRVIDTAEMYGEGRSETLVGEAIGGRRDDVVLVSKVYPWNASRRGTLEACQASLRRLGTDHLDLYLLHWRGEHPLAETVAAMDQLVADGAIGAWGVSNFDAGDMRELWSVPGGHACATDQVLYNLTRRGPEVDLLPLLREREVPTMAYSPIEQARLLAPGAGRDALDEVAARHEATAAQIALAWVIRDGDVLAIPRSGSVEHTRENAGALGVTLTGQDLAELDAAFPAPDHPVPLETL